MKYIETLREGERVANIYLCKYRQSAVTKNGKAYENVYGKKSFPPLRSDDGHEKRTFVIQQ